MNLFPHHGASFWSWHFSVSGSSRHLSPLGDSASAQHVPPPLPKTPRGLMVSSWKTFKLCSFAFTLSASFSSVCGLFSCWV